MKHLEYLNSRDFKNDLIKNKRIVITIDEEDGWADMTFKKTFTYKYSEYDKEFSIDSFQHSALNKYYKNFKSFLKTLIKINTDILDIHYGY